MNDIPNRDRFETAYKGTPPWDLGRPQKPFIDVADQITGSVLDAGCGTGSIALFFAQRGRSVMGIDFIDKPINEAKRKARDLGIEAEFAKMDVLNLKGLDRKFDAVIDCGLFHVLTDEDRSSYVDALAHVTKRDGKVFLMCFSDKEPGDDGPRRIREDELRAAFTVGWAIESIAPSQFETIAESEKKFSLGGPRAWFAIMRRES